ncbi:hypothetical protein, partial [Methylocaldum sp.]|uniref:hypothetical protein n=1 Tax=Methylocaldum sp. TaxID=1969727 RepID=UPI002D6C2D4D
MDTQVSNDETDDCVAIFYETFWDIPVSKRSKLWRRVLPSAPRPSCVRPVPTQPGVGTWLHNDSTPGRDALWVAYDRRSR